MDSCESGYVAAPAQRGSLRCFWKLTRDYPGVLEQIEARLVELQEEEPEDPWIPYYRAAVRWSEPREEIPDLYLRAAELARQVGDAEAEFQARSRRVRYLVTRLGRETEARRELETLKTLEISAENRPFRAKLDLEIAYFQTLLFEDLEDAVLRLYRIEGDGLFDDCGLFASEEDCRQEERRWLKQVLETQHALGLYEEEKPYLRRLEALTASDEHSQLASLAFYWAALHAADLPTDEAKERVGIQAEKALQLSRPDPAIDQTENRSVRLLSLELLGRLGDEASLEECLAVAEEGSPFRLGCLAARAESGARSGDATPEILFQWLDEARGIARDARDPWSLFTVRQARSRVLWGLGQNQRALEEGLALLKAIERQRALQPAQSGRAQVFAVWWEAYSWLAGRLLGTEGGTQRETLEQAFGIMERARAGVLKEQLAMAMPGQSEWPAEIARQLEDLELQRADLQIRLWDLGGFDTPLLDSDPEPVAILKTRLRANEVAANGLRHQLARDQQALNPQTRDPQARNPQTRDQASEWSPLEPPTLAELEAGLEDDEAFLFYQVAPERDLFDRPSGGSWVVVSTGDRSTAFPLQDEVEIHDRVESLTATVEGTTFQNQLFEVLLSEALESLPDSVSRLVIVPDGPLHSLPFEVLRRGDSEPLASRFELSYVPSATLWLRWRRSSHPAAEVPALILANPEVQSGLADGRSRAFFRSDPRQPLRYAESEGETVLRRLPGGSVLLTGPEASENALVDQDLDRFALIHFAAHARAAPVLASRSAVYLAPGPGEDGFLQPDEIAALDLRDRLVVLGTCDSVAGDTLRGEGLLSLGQAFFRAGARTVVGSRRPLSDRGALCFFESFYRQLARGDSVGRALAVAQKDLRDAGATDKDWSALVVLGDAAMVPFPDGVEGSLPGHCARPWARSPWLAISLLLAMLLVVGWRFSLRRSRG